MRVAHLALVAACALVACHHDGPGGPVPVKPAHPVDDPAIASARDALAFLPADAELVLAVDAKQLTSSALWRDYWPRLEPVVAAGVSKLNASCGLDVWRTTERIAIAVQHLDGERAGVFVVRGPDVARLLECITADKTEGSVVTTDRGVVVNKKADTAVAAKVIGGSTLVIQLGPGANASSLSAIIAAGAPLRASAGFVSYFGQLDEHSSVWMVLNGNGSAAKQLASIGAHPRSIYGALTVSDRLAFVLHLALGSADEATQLTGSIGPQLSALKSMFEQLDINAAGPVATVKGALNKAQLASLVGMVGGGGGGGDGGP